MKSSAFTRQAPEAGNLRWVVKKTSTIQRRQQQRCCGFPLSFDQRLFSAVTTQPMCKKGDAGDAQGHCVPGKPAIVAPITGFYQCHTT